MKPEQVMQINLVNWFGWAYPDYKEDLHHFANERKCSYNEGRTLKRMSVQAGVLDLFLALPRQNWGGLWLELKITPNELTKEQKEFMKRKQKNGYVCAAVWDKWEEGKDIIIEYLK